MPYTAGLTAGKYYDGVLPQNDVVESALVHPSHSDGFVDKDDPVYAYTDGYGNAAIVGIARISAAAATDDVPIARDGIFNLTADCADGTGDTAIAAGDPLYLTSAGVLDQNPSGVYFGRALAAKGASATPSVIPVGVGVTFGVRPANGLERTESLTAAAPALHTFGLSELDSTSNAVDGTLANGTFIGQIKIIRMTEASNSSTITIANHTTSDPEVATFNALGEELILMWAGTQWHTVSATATFV